MTGISKILKAHASLIAAVSVLFLLAGGAFALLYKAASQTPAPKSRPAFPQPATVQAVKDGESISVTFYAEGFSPYKKSVTQGQSYGSLPHPERNGYTFGGWYTAENGEGKLITENSPVSLRSEHALYGLWYKNPVITFDPNGGSIGGDATQTLSYKESAALKSAESMVVSHTKPGFPSVADFALIGGYTFSGWSTKSDGSGTFYTNEAEITLTEDLTLYAQWNNYLRAPSAREEARIVTLSKPFYLCTHEVTQAEYEKYCFYGGKQPSKSYGLGEDIPAYYVSWYDAILYCNARSRAEGLKPVYALNFQRDVSKWKGVISDGEGRICAAGDADFSGLEADFTADGYRLPTEAEWQYAALGDYIGKGWQGYGDDIYAGYAPPQDGKKAQKPASFMWYQQNSNNKAHAVKQREPNSYGLYDMSGNVWEWCADWYDANYYSTSPAADPKGPSMGSNYVTRGGGWGNLAPDCRTPNRDYNTPTGWFDGQGLRLALQ